MIYHMIYFIYFNRVILIYQKIMHDKIYRFREVILLKTLHIKIQHHEV